MTGKIKILLLVLLILSGLVLLVDNPFSRRFEPEGTLLFPSLKKDAVTAIEIENLMEGIRLTKDEKGDWKVEKKQTELARKIEEQESRTPDKKKEGRGETSKETGPVPADPAKADQVIALLAGLKKGTPVSTNPEKQGQFQVTEVALNVTLFDKGGSKLARIFVGKQGPNFFSTFIRADGSSEVYLSEETFTAGRQPLEEWKKKEEGKQTEPEKP